MKTVFAGLFLVVALAASGCAPTGMSASLSLRSAPPPPSFEFNSEPRFNYLSSARVSVIDDENFGYDMFNSGGNYYLYSGGNWYRSGYARGPFVAIEARRVPRSIFNVDDRQYRWRSHPEGWRAGQPQVGRDERADGRAGGEGR
jgi:hypothetical protein